MNPSKKSTFVVRLLDYCIAPGALYFFLFCVYSFPLLLHFNTHFFTHPLLDGIQNVWNLWWVDKALTVLYQSPWQTPYLHYPFGVTLVGHTLNPFNGFLAIPLLRFLTLLQAYNAIVIFSFVAGGLSAFYLAYYFSRSYWPSVVAGALFTFSGYHFIHMETGHLQLIALEWIPLFVLCAHRLLARPGLMISVASAAVLFLVFLCDYYYFMYCCMFLCILIAWKALCQRKLFFLEKEQFFSLISFLIIVAATTGPQIFSLFSLSRNEELLGIHQPLEYSADLFSPFIHGAFWRFAGLTEFYWKRLPCYFGECSLHLGWVVIFVLGYAWRKRGQLKEAGMGLWFFVLCFFFVLSLGPSLHVFGTKVPHLLMPYQVLSFIFPPLRLSGVPARMSVMVFLSASVIFALGLRLLAERLGKRRWVVAALLAVLFLEYFPARLSLFKIHVPDYLITLRKEKVAGGVFDAVNGRTLSLYFQTIHEKPLVFGYVSRIPKSLDEKNDVLSFLFQRKDFARLYQDFGIKYFIVPEQLEIKDDRLSVRLLGEDGYAKLYGLSEKK